MNRFTIQSLLAEDGTWQHFEEDWRDQCARVGEDFADYAPDSMAVLRGLAAGEAERSTRSQTSVAAICETGTAGPFHAVCMVNRTLLPGVEGYTLRIRHLLISPMLDFGEWEPSFYADVMIGVVSGIIYLSSTIFDAQHLRFHLRSPTDMAFFRGFGAAMEETKMFTPVQMRGAWLLMSKGPEFRIPRETES